MQVPTHTNWAKRDLSGINVDSGKERDVFFPWDLVGKDGVNPELLMTTLEARIPPQEKEQSQGME